MARRRRVFTAAFAAGDVDFRFGTAGNSGASSCYLIFVMQCNVHLDYGQRIHLHTVMMVAVHERKRAMSLHSTQVKQDKSKGVDQSVANDSYP